MPFNMETEVVSQKQVSLEEAERLAMSQPVLPTVAIDIDQVTRNGKQYMALYVPLEVSERETRLVHNTLKSGVTQTKGNISCVGSIPNGITAKITANSGVIKQYPVKNNSVLRVSIGMVLGSGTVVGNVETTVPATAKAASK